MPCQNTGPVPLRILSNRHYPEVQPVAHLNALLPRDHCSVFQTKPRRSRLPVLSRRFERSRTLRRGDALSLSRKGTWSRQCFSRSERPTDNQCLRRTNLCMPDFCRLLQPVRRPPRKPATFQPCAQGRFFGSTKHALSYNVTLPKYHSGFANPLKLVSNGIKCVHREQR